MESIKSPTKQIRSQLEVLLHCKKCFTSSCSTPNCEEFKAVLVHMNTCKEGRACQGVHCASSRQILRHWESCKNDSCVLCTPVRITGDYKYPPSTSSSSCSSHVEQIHSKCVSTGDAAGQNWVRKSSKVAPTTEFQQQSNNNNITNNSSNTNTSTNAIPESNGYFNVDRTDNLSDEMKLSIRDAVLTAMNNMLPQLEHIVRTAVRTEMSSVLLATQLNGSSLQPPVHHEPSAPPGYDVMSDQQSIYSQQIAQPDSMAPILPPTSSQPFSTSSTAVTPQPAGESLAAPLSSTPPLMSTQQPPSLHQPPLQPSSHSLTTPLQPSSHSLTTPLPPTSHSLTTPLAPASHSLSAPLPPSSQSILTPHPPTSNQLSSPLPQDQMPLSNAPRTPSFRNPSATPPLNTPPVIPFIPPPAPHHMPPSPPRESLIMTPPSQQTIQIRPRQHHHHNHLSNFILPSNNSSNIITSPILSTSAPTCSPYKHGIGEKNVISQSVMPNTKQSMTGLCSGGSGRIASEVMKSPLMDSPSPNSQHQLSASSPSVHSFSQASPGSGSSQSSLVSSLQGASQIINSVSPHAPMLTTAASAQCDVQNEHFMGSPFF